MSDEQRMVGLIEMKPIPRIVEFRDPSRGDEANWRSFLAEINRVPEDEVRDIEFVDAGRFGEVRYKIAVYYEPPRPEAVVIDSLRHADGKPLRLESWQTAMLRDPETPDA